MRDARGVWTGDGRGFFPGTETDGGSPYLSHDIDIHREGWFQF
jgi:hypothetical protein